MPPEETHSLARGCGSRWSDGGGPSVGLIRGGATGHPGGSSWGGRGGGGTTERQARGGRREGAGQCHGSSMLVSMCAMFVCELGFWAVDCTVWSLSAFVTDPQQQRYCTGTLYRSASVRVQYNTFEALGPWYASYADSGPMQAQLPEYPGIPPACFGLILVTIMKVIKLSSISDHTARPGRCRMGWIRFLPLLWVMS